MSLEDLVAGKYIYKEGSESCSPESIEPLGESSKIFKNEMSSQQGTALGEVRDARPAGRALEERGPVGEPPGQ